MHKFLFLFVFSLQAFASDTPVLEKRTGYLDRQDGVQKYSHCKIYAESAFLKGLDFRKAILAADKEPNPVVAQFEPTTPSVEIWANLEEEVLGPSRRLERKTRSISLLLDSRGASRREGDSAASLMKIAEEACRP